MQCVSRNTDSTMHHTIITELDTVAGRFVATDKYATWELQCRESLGERLLCCAGVWDVVVRVESARINRDVRVWRVEDAWAPA